MAACLPGVASTAMMARSTSSRAEIKSPVALLTDKNGEAMEIAS